MSILSEHMAGRHKHSRHLWQKGIRLRAQIKHVCPLFIVAGLIMLTACTGSLIVSQQASGVYHRVKKGETLYKIAHVYGVPLQHLAEVNNIDQGEIIEVGRALFIPDVQAVADDILVAGKTQEAAKNTTKTPVAPQKKPSQQGGGVASKPGLRGPGIKEPMANLSVKQKDPSQSPADGKPAVASQGDKTTFPLKLPSVLHNDSTDGERTHSAPEGAQIQREKMLFLWPVSGKVVSLYGIQSNGMFFNGIKITAPEGTPVIAAADGVVIFSAPLKDYGETIILKHDNDYASVYTLLGPRLVKREDRIKKGDKMATLAKSEMKGESSLNFEIRYKNRARNPLFFLP